MDFGNLLSTAIQAGTTIYTTTQAQRAAKRQQLLESIQTQRMYTAQPVSMPAAAAVASSAAVGSCGAALAPGADPLTGVVAVAVLLSASLGLALVGYFRRRR